MDSVMEVYLASVQAGGGIDYWDLIFGADLVVQLVLYILIFMSILSWAVMVQKQFQLFMARRQSAQFLELFWRSKRLDSVYEQTGKFKRSPVAEVFKAGYQELAKVTKGGSKADAGDNMMRALRRARQVEETKLESYVSFLGTTGSTAPFIGLLGTVWGILLAFQRLASASGAASIQVVGPDISHALIATAAGLFAAIPAVMAFNYFHAGIKVLNVEMDNFSADFLNIVKRHIK